ncbi:hypothetical protein [Noviherbaspirillum pedocola]|uniref:Uncharacterized protein n=1 Tax=Noviherbaspirillum pedocola TaxID=2801341 RepID=A0A934T1K7_9BURK|nr:hypothetical protein [Noviherbaspirillum pedocola]MBK4735878.1 hypothetical protein [Noviherbaspirillum pedocola]
MEDVPAARRRRLADVARVVVVMVVMMAMVHHVNALGLHNRLGGVSRGLCKRGCGNKDACNGGKQLFHDDSLSSSIGQL